MLLALVQALSRWMIRRSGLLWRILICWIIGVTVFLGDEFHRLDSRFLIRGDQQIAPEIVLVPLTAQDLHESKNTANSLAAGDALSDRSDGFYWDPLLWPPLLERILSQNPRKVGVALFFPDYLDTGGLSPKERSLLQDPRLVWLGPSLQLSDASALPLFGRFHRRNWGHPDYPRDEDGTVRKFLLEDSHFAAAVTGASAPPSPGELRYLNFRGTEFFQRKSAREILKAPRTVTDLQDKIVLIGSPSAHLVLTPLGAVSRLELLGQTADNLLYQRWILRAPSWVYFLFLLALVVLCSLTMNQYPQSVAAILLVWVSTLYCALSIWIFDTWYFWLPISSILIQILATYIVFLGYQANKIERKHWVLRQEQKNLAQLETLKNNFVSLISHDLKTPISKIQAVAQRLRLQPEAQFLQRDLTTIEESTDELNRYIQSVLQLLRVESRDFRLQPSVGDLNETIEQVLRQLRPLAVEKNIHLETALEPLFSIEADFVLLREVILNLVQNAIQYSLPGSQVKISSSEEIHGVQVKVEDSGMGIAPEDQDKVWRKFVRGSGADLGSKGTGLGLYLVKFFIELHGGKVGLQSELGRGTKVWFFLPLEGGPEEGLPGPKN